MAPEMEKRLRWFWKPTLDQSGRVDEPYVKVKGRWAYLYRAVDQCGNTIDFYLSPTRNIRMDKRFFGKALKSIKTWAHTETINIDKAPAFGPAIDELKKDSRCPKDTVHRQVKYLNNAIEADHGKLKRLINPIHGFKSMKTAYATIKGFELMHMFRKGQMDIWKNGQGLIGEIFLIEKNLISTAHNQ